MRFAPLVVLPLLKLALHLATFGGYGWFRDEFYYVACARRLAWGYVDHPPLSVALLRPLIDLFGTSLFVVRLLPAMAGAATVLLVGLIARDMGGGRFAQALAMTSAIAGPLYLGTHHVFSMNAFDVLLWAAGAWLIVRVARGERASFAWLGVVVGLGLLNKLSMLWMAGGLVVGLLLTRERAWLRTRGPYGAAGIAVLIFAPHVLWQFAHGWPTLEFMANAGALKMAVRSPLDFLGDQIWMMTPVGAIVWGAGLAWLLAARAALTYRVLGWAFLAVFVVLAANGTSRASYLGPAFTWLLAAGGVAVESATATSRRWIRPALVTGLVAAGVVFAPLALPVLPVDRYIAYAAALGRRPSTEERKEVGPLPQQYADMHGWTELVEAVTLAWADIPADARASTIVFGQNYGEAGAVEVLGRARGLPPATAGHNSYWLWGPPPADIRHAIVIDGDPEELAPVCSVMRVVTRTSCGYCMPYENDNPVTLCLDMRRSFRDVWPTLKHYD